ncbi:unnamed protein product [Arabidopsis lyrata]|uniref:Uncharacterized protein n=1 Tax=Arabidopsis suecica TaxID=45249 RepID=A0A8T1ZW05_ARASU|nr:hypothetical protein ISN44_As10g017840 [Arabidopsis suecica]CAH8273593.1 unnamed protein product [Arabidopsis lyrata]
MKPKFHETQAKTKHVEDRGGFVSNLPGDVPRVNGQLAVSHAFEIRDLRHT